MESLQIDQRQTRTLSTCSVVPYYQLSFIPSLATLAGLPATTFPTGEITSEGLPVGLQATGAYLEDNTTIGFCQLLEQRFGGFNRPPE